MNTRSHFFLTALLICLCFLISAQDLHFTNYKFAPLAINPAKTGAFYGSYRVSIVYRDQFDSFIQKGYKTSMLNLDGTLRLGFAENHWIGWGFNILTDKAGDLGFKNSGILGSVAYHMGLDKKLNNVITLGVQYGAIQRKLTQMNQAQFGDFLAEFNSGNTSFVSPDQQMFAGYQETYNDLNIGMQFKSVLSKRAGLELGGAVMHLVGSDRQRSIMNKTFLRVNGHATLRYQTGKQFIIEPAIYVSSSQRFLDLSIQINGEYLLKDLDQTILLIGVGHRINDALQFMVGMQYKRWLVGLSYDMTTSSASVYNSSVGGFEISAQYILNVFKRPDPEPAFFCPRF
jgi:type IX secretion system PorP/SprF family membrane protein